MKKTDKKTDIKEETKEETKQEPSLEEDNKKLKEEVEKYKNEYYRAYADMQNLRKIVEKDHKEAIKYRAEGFVEDLLPILDGFHMALSANVKSDEMKAFLTGFEFIYRNLVTVLENNGVTELSPKVGDNFDPVTMQALETREDENYPENKVLEIKVKGYKLHDHLVRPSIVVVSGKKEEPETKEETEEHPTVDA